MNDEVDGREENVSNKFCRVRSWKVEAGRSRLEGGGWKEEAGSPMTFF
jgi:hypothetical protein